MAFISKWHFLLFWEDLICIYIFQKMSDDQKKNCFMCVKIFYHEAGLNRHPREKHEKEHSLFHASVQGYHTWGKTFHCFDTFVSSVWSSLVKLCNMLTDLMDFRITGGRHILHPYNSHLSTSSSFPMSLVWLLYAGFTACNTNPDLFQVYCGSGALKQIPSVMQEFAYMEGDLLQQLVWWNPFLTPTVQQA